MSEIIDITWEELNQKSADEYWLFDIRSELDFSFGHAPGAVNLERDTLFADQEKLNEMQKRSEESDWCVIIMCKRGEFSLEVAQELRQKNIRAYSFFGGYNGWLMENLTHETKAEEEVALEEQKAGLQEGSGNTDAANQSDSAQQIPRKNKEPKTKAEQVELSIRKKFHKDIFSQFTKAINQYQLVCEGDKIAVCISGGKDSMLMAKLFQELQKHNKVSFEVVFMVMDPGYSPANRAIIEQNAKLLGIQITIFESDIFDAVFDVEKSPCYLCARMRRGHLYQNAQKLGCNKIALGHHYDDVIETILMGMLYGAQVQTMMPKLHSTNFQGMELIRPLYLIREDAIKHWRDYNDLHFIQCACKFTDTCTTCNSESTGSKRQEIKQLIRQMKQDNPYVEANIFKSIENVNLDTVIGYKQGGIRHSFLDAYDKEEECSI